MLSNSQSYIQYPGTGVQTVFPFGFPVQQASFLVVTLTNNNVVPPVTTVLMASQYTVAPTGGSWPTTAGGTVTYGTASPLPVGWNITIQRLVPLQQNTSLQNQGSMYPQVVEAALDYLTMAVQQLEAAATGFTALTGPAGSTVWNGTGAPSAGTGNNGDFYINTSTWYIYGPKAVGAWPAGVALIGSTGASGNTIWNGTTTPSSGLGANGDFYINTATNTIYGPKASGAWPGGVSLVGSQGNTGATGAAGVNWTGSWSSTTAYVANQGVTYGGYGYVAVRASTNVAPAGNPSYWACLVVGANRNRLINGAMRIDQRNAGAIQSITTGGGNQYTVDRWFATAAGTNIQGQQLTGNAGQPWKNYYMLTGAASNGGWSFNQRIESTCIFDLASTQVTISVFAGGTNFTSMAWAASCPNVSADNWGASTVCASGSWTIINDGTFHQYQATFTLPTSAVYGLQITFSGGVGVGLLSGQYAWITGVQLEAGAIATPFEWRPDDTELLRCQRYLPCFRSSSVISLLGMGQCISGTAAYIVLPFPVQSRVVPTGITVSGASHIDVLGGGGAAQTSSGIALGTYVSTMAAQINITGTTATEGNATSGFFNTASGYIYFTGCEL